MNKHRQLSNREYSWEQGTIVESLGSSITKGQPSTKESSLRAFNFMEELILLMYGNNVKENGRAFNEVETKVEDTEKLSVLEF